MVTHDRYFLERVCTEIIELDNGQLYRYKGSYSYLPSKRKKSEWPWNKWFKKRPKTCLKRTGLDAASAQSKNDKIQISD